MIVRPIKLFKSPMHNLKFVNLMKAFYLSIIVTWFFRHLNQNNMAILFFNFIKFGKTVLSSLSAKFILLTRIASLSCHLYH